MYERDVEVTLASLLTCEVDLGGTLGWLSHMRGTLGQLWDHFGITFAFESDFGSTLASL